MAVAARSSASSSSKAPPTLSHAPQLSTSSTPGLLLPSTSWLVGGDPGTRDPAAVPRQADSGIATPRSTRSLSPASCKSAPPSPRLPDQVVIPLSEVWSTPVRRTGTASGSNASAISAQGPLTPGHTHSVVMSSPPSIAASSTPSRQPSSRVPTNGRRQEGSPQTGMLSHRGAPSHRGALSYREATTSSVRGGQPLLPGKQQRSPRAMGGCSMQQLLTAKGTTLQRSSPTQPQMLSLQRTGPGVASSPSLLRVVHPGQTHFGNNQRAKR